MRYNNLTKRPRQLSVYLEEDDARFVQEQCENLQISESAYARNLIQSAKHQYRHHLAKKARRTK